MVKVVIGSTDLKHIFLTNERETVWGKRGEDVTVKKTDSKIIMVMHKDDNVGVCIRPVDTGKVISYEQAGSGFQLETRDPIPLGHKVALKDIQTGRPVVKYGEIIGKSTKKITRGEHVHTHNVTDFT